MSKINTGGPAFPFAYETSDGLDQTIHINEGMSLRDYTAIHAPQPDISQVELHEKLDRSRNPHNDSYKPKIRSRAEIVSALRYEFADAMIAEREKGGAS